ncbi:MAG: hypothetical protein P0S93_02140 [Candidatus Neptunochlamydia sp.]|nr:hypothetical protein [Candidatus Neptunochlamydia sp.]
MEKLHPYRNHLKQTLQESKLFTSGTQKRDDRFDKLYKQFFCEIRVPEALIKNTSQSLANHSPTQQLVESLKKIIEKEYGLQEQFLEELKNNNKKFSSLELEESDSHYRNYYLFCRLFPKCFDTMKSIFQDLLALEFLKNPNRKYSLSTLCASTDGEEEIEAIKKRVWEETKLAIEGQKKHDKALSERNWKQLKTDLYQTVSSVGLSLASKNPQYAINQVARTGTNLIGRALDPEGKSKGVTFLLKLLSNTATSYAMKGNGKALIKSLAVDLIDLSTRSK